VIYPGAAVAVKITQRLITSIHFHLDVCITYHCKQLLTHDGSRLVLSCPGCIICSTESQWHLSKMVQKPPVYQFVLIRFDDIGTFIKLKMASHRTWRKHWNWSVVRSLLTHCRACRFLRWYSIEVEEIAIGSHLICRRYRKVVIGTLRMKAPLSINSLNGLKLLII